MLTYPTNSSKTPYLLLQKLTQGEQVLMSEENPQFEIIQSRTFEKALNRLSEDQKDLVDEQVAKIEENPEIGARKKGDLSHLWVHKFKLDGRETLLGYSFVEQKLELYLLNLGPHENFYDQVKRRRKADIKLMS
jgi:mRNA-degrading endonuclease RelE of RelBE toxin-antitoxin system